MNNCKKVLVVDSDSEFADACREVFEANSYHVSIALDESQARRMLKTRPDMIILSTLAPGGTAFDLHNWIRGHYQYKNLPLMVIDAPYDEMQARGWRLLEGLQIDADEYISKPVDPAALLPIAMRLEERLALAVA